MSKNNYKLFSGALILLFVLGTFPIKAYAQFAAGTGSEEDPYLIETAEELNAVRESKGANIYFRLSNDIDLTSYLSEEGEGYDDGQGWESIADFTGHFDGSGYSIKGLWINRPTADGVGLFGKTLNASISNLGVILDNDKGGILGGNTIGGMIGGTDKGNGVTIRNCFVIGNVSASDEAGESNVGGFAGTINKVALHIINCYYIGEVSSANDIGRIGGIAGFVLGKAAVTIENCYAVGSVSGSCAGGLVGHHEYFSSSTPDADNCLKIYNSLALNESISSTGEAGRIVGIVKGSLGTNYDLSDNRAFEEMLVKEEMIADGAVDNKNGENITKDDLALESSYPNWIFDEDNWQLGNGNYTLPVLLIGNDLMGNQPSTLPSYLEKDIYDEGTGTVEDPYMIKDPIQLNGIRDRMGAEVYFCLSNDIDLASYLSEEGEGYDEGQGWLPISGFTGHFDGNGYSIKGLWINRPTADGVGLFGKTFNASISNLGVILDNEKGGILGGNTIGGMIGGTDTGNGVTIRSCFVIGNVSASDEEGESNVGGLVGTVNKVPLHISNCYYIGEVSSANEIGRIGGIAGFVLGKANVIIENSYVVGSVSGSCAGGLVGQQLYFSSSVPDADNCLKIYNSLALNEAVTSTGDAGRIIGRVAGSLGTAYDLSGNQAFEEMRINDELIEEGNADNKEGADIAKSELSLEATYTDWTFEDGHWQSGNGDYTLPVLMSGDKLITNQLTDLPEYLVYKYDNLENIYSGSNISIVSPNPTTGKIYITKENPSSEIIIYTSTGSQVYIGYESVVDLSSMMNGVYLLKVEGQVVKVVKN